MNSDPSEPLPRRCGRGYFVPLLIIGLGVIFLLNQFQIVSTDRAIPYFWPGAFLFFGIEALTCRGGRHGATWGFASLLVGLALLLRLLGFWSFDVANLWPLLLIGFGLSLLFRGPTGRRAWRRRHSAQCWNREWDTAASSADAQLSGAAVLGGIQRRVTAQDFRGGHLTAFFGGFNVDLTRAGIAGDSAVLDLSALFGGGEIRVPDTWIIDIQSQAFLGAYTDETHQSIPAAGAKRLVIQGLAVFGGVVIKN